MAENRNGLHCASKGGNDGFHLFDWWSQIDQLRYDAETVRVKWESFGFDDQVVTLDTLFYEANRRGYAGPSLKCAEKYSEVSNVRKKIINSAKLQRKSSLEKFNREHGVLCAGPKNYIVTRQKDPALGFVRTCYRDLTAEQQRCENLLIPKLVLDKNGEVVEVSTESIFKTWMRWDKRRTYSQQALLPAGGMVAPHLEGKDPAELPPGDIYNLFIGLHISPVEGDCSLILQHIKEVWCSGCEESYRYITGWLARLIQHPDKPALTAIVLKSVQGAGKNIVIDVLVKAFGNNARIFSSSKDVSGSFNAQAVCSVLVVANEASWGGDKSAEGNYKAMITDDFLMANEKFIPVIQVKNCVHLIIMSNNDWVVPVDMDDRRFFFPSVSGHRKGDSKYFDRLRRCIDHGGDSALMHYLLNYDLAGFDVRRIPDIQSQTKLEHKLKGADSVTQWWMECLAAEQIGLADDRLLLSSPQWAEEGQGHQIVTTDLYNAYSRWVRNKGGKHVDPLETFGRKLKDFGCSKRRLSRSTGTDRDRPNGYQIPLLSDARKEVETLFGAIDWD